ncbi:hypothetical protein DOTSEDRAFT_39006 [Dothistroma septosporum NZE10]|uniref:Uncharacterized protein n=1 Tax=Dothistroma septosporum (strain NZE10 / CBS 128990) TaxID=675120 RepID=M2Y0E5_DOTSN|nr:hypothetical protein DOTSEDRAFT_39006 [Dothistroma septosporum NZE10]
MPQKRGRGLDTGKHHRGVHESTAAIVMSTTPGQITGSLALLSIMTASRMGQLTAERGVQQPITRTAQNIVPTNFRQYVAAMQYRCDVTTRCGFHLTGHNYYRIVSLWSIWRAQGAESGFEATDRLLARRSGDHEDAIAVHTMLAGPSRATKTRRDYEFDPSIQKSMH